MGFARSFPHYAKFFCSCVGSRVTQMHHAHGQLNGSPRELQLSTSREGGELLWDPSLQAEEGN